MIIDVLGEVLMALNTCSMREKPNLLKLYQALYQDLLADLRKKMAAPKSGPTKTLITKIKHHGS